MRFTITPDRPWRTFVNGVLTDTVWPAELVLDLDDLGTVQIPLRELAEAIKPFLVEPEAHG